MAIKTLKSYQEPGKRLQLIQIYNDKRHVYVYKIVLNRRIISTTYNLEQACRNFFRECYKLAEQTKLFGGAESIQAPNHE